MLKSGHDTIDAEIIFKIMRRTLEIFEYDRRLIEDELFGANLPGMSRALPVTVLLQLGMLAMLVLIATGTVGPASRNL